jgi:uncharacterized RDD family membrane protein YckC
MMTFEVKENAMENAVTTDGQGLAIANFWRRLGALLCDAIVLGLIGFLVGVVLFEPLARMGFYARLIGFAIALAYFGIGNSRLAQGQTPGKRLLSLRVVDARGEPLSLPRSLLRYIVLGTPFFLSGLPVTTPMALVYALGLVILGSMLSTVYLYVFNRRTRQALHDLAVGSYVVWTEPAATPVPVQPVWRGHFVAVAAVLVLILAGMGWAQHAGLGDAFADLWPMQREIAGQPHVMSAGVARNWSSFNGKQTRSLSARLLLDGPYVDDKELAHKVAVILARGDRQLAEEDLIGVQLVHGFDMGIASGWRAHSYSFKPDELR